MSKHHKLANVNYRALYEAHKGAIPDGYHIHHVDGNPYNNDIHNLIAVSAEEHAKIHNHDGIKWASIGGKLGGQKSKKEKLGFCGWTFEQRSVASKGRTHSELTKLKTSKTLKMKLNSGEIKHWTEMYDSDTVSKKISAGDPGKSRRGKPSWNKGIKMTLSDPELARSKKSQAAIKRQKYPCPNCGKCLDKGNLTKHSNKCKTL
jgi:hypothetical protein